MSEAAVDELGAPPPASKEGISKMADAFRKQMSEAHPENAKRVPPQAATAPPAPKEPKAAEPVKAAPMPSPSPAPSPAKAPEVDPSMPKNAKDWKAHNEVKEKAIAEAKQFRAEADALKQEAATLKAELDGLKKGTAEYERVKSEHEATKKQLGEYQEIINRFSLENDPRFQAHYNEKRKLGVDIAKATVTSPEMAAKLESILALSPSRQRDEQIMALGAEMDDFGRARLASAYVQIEQIEREKHQELSRSAENLAKAREVETKRQQMELAAMQAQQKTFVETVFQRIDPELEGADKNESATFKEQMRQIATNSFEPKVFLEVAGLAAKGRKFDATVNALKEENAKLQAQVQELTAANPTPNGTGSGQPVRRTSGAPDSTGRELGNRFREALSKRQAER